MSPEQLLAHFDRVAEAPGAIPRLRQFILDLAVRGKLVEQDPADVPATELLSEVLESHSRSTQGRRRPVPTRVQRDEMPFPVPNGWEVVRLGLLTTKLGAGSTPLGGKAVYQIDGVPFIRSQNVHNDGLRLSDAARISRATHERMSGTHVQPKDVLLNITGASIGRCAVVPDDFVEGNVSQHVAIIRLVDPRIRHFVHLSLISPVFQSLIERVQVGVSREGLSMQRLRQFPLLLPSLAEQRRIVAKVDELMALCDRLEAAQAERERRRDCLAALSLARVNLAFDAPQVRRGVRVQLSNHHRLLTRSEHIRSFRQMILNLTFKGYLSSAGSVQKPEALRQLACAQNGYAFKSEWFVHSGMRLLRNVNVGHGVVRWNDVECLPEDRVWEFERFRLSEHDVVFSLDRPFITTGIKVARVRRDDLPCLLLQRVARLQIKSDRITSDYLFLWLQSEDFANQLSPGRSNGVPHVSSKQVEATRIPVPTVAEQRRIVAEVDELMVICDRLEAQLEIARVESYRLLEAVLQKALPAASTGHP